MAHPDEDEMQKVFVDLTLSHVPNSCSLMFDGSLRTPDPVFLKRLGCRTVTAAQSSDQRKS